MATDNMKLTAGWKIIITPFFFLPFSQTEMETIICWLVEDKPVNHISNDTAYTLLLMYMWAFHDRGLCCCVCHCFRCFAWHSQQQPFRGSPMLAYSVKENVRLNNAKQCMKPVVELKAMLGKDWKWEAGCRSLQGQMLVVPLGGQLNWRVSDCGKDHSQHPLTQNWSVTGEGQKTSSVLNRALSRIEKRIQAETIWLSDRSWRRRKSYCP